MNPVVGFLPSEQVGPVYPSWHTQEKPSTSSVQLSMWTHGLLSHSSISEIKYGNFTSIV